MYVLMLNVIDTGRMRLVKSLPVSPVLFRYFSCFFEGFTGKYFYISGQGNLVKLNVLDKAKKNQSSALHWNLKEIPVMT